MPLTAAQKIVVEQKIRDGIAGIITELKSLNLDFDDNTGDFIKKKSAKK